MNWREFRLKKGKKFQVWRIRQAGESYVTEHGQLDGKMQTFTDTPGDKGKSDTKAYVNAEDNCTFHVEREIRKKEEHGYVEYVDGEPVKEQVTSIDFNKPLPKNFCGYKPQTSISDSALAKMHKAGNAIYTRKRDGMMHLAVKHPWGWEIYTRRMDLASERFPNHIEALNSSSLNVGTIIVGEMICQNDTTDDFKAISRICRSDPPEARKLVEDKEVPEPIYYMFDILYHNGEELSNEKFARRRTLIEGEIYNISNDLIKAVSFYNVTPDTWEEYAKEKGWEGFVVVDKSSVPGDKFFSFDGDAKRPKGHHKLKPVYESDVVIYAGLYGTGKRQGKVGSVLVKQKHPETGDWFRCGKVGSGFTEEDIEEVGKLLADKNLPILSKEKEDKNELDDSGIVCMIEYSERQLGTNKFRFPVFMRVRDDKLPHECVAQRLAPEEE